MKQFEETPVQFGPSSGLFGMLTRPGVGMPSEPVGCLMFNFGIHTHIGPRRVQVKLARRLARQGVSSLRFDLSGVGESPSPSSGMPFDLQAQNDLKAAVDLLQSSGGVSRIAVIGLCSGAGHGLRFALQDARVAGLLMFDAYRFAGVWSNVARRFQRFRRSPWAQGSHWIKRLLGAKAPGDNMLETNEPEVPVKASDFSRSMEVLLSRAVSVYLVYSASLGGSDKRHDQLKELRGADFLSRVRYEFMPELDHSFTLLAGQARFGDGVEQWMQGLNLAATRTA
ncbi:alpha/beta fold hydrolase [Variovorax sp. PAMC 28711]|uniref:alpha/beta fold hydrolase n=1 Tax=Variovorax sp. PAMC 28711 TaxID=1795631 RepID=UPI00078BED63|nr:alpha/beta fold hydrolase [Variovorax sp. PAMC 28711]AMM24062.1 hypothetical protein AX767_06670 [Variovorax sp. PAMC 28711]